MRDEFSYWAARYPAAVAEGNDAFAGSEVARFVTVDLAAAVRSALPNSGDRYTVEGSAGRGQWTFTPWVAVLDQGVTTSVQEGYYIVYLLSADGSRLFLSINQGCTRLHSALGTSGAASELRRRAAVMLSRIKKGRRRLNTSPIALGVDVWRGRLYEAGDVANVSYETSKLPEEYALRQDLAEALTLYEMLAGEGGWEPDDAIAVEAEQDAGIIGDLAHAKRYKRHRSVERIGSHAKIVKRAQGYRCRGCDLELRERYGDIAATLIEAHHLTPLAMLAEGDVAIFDPYKDFAVLCPNCHAVIHLMSDPSDIEGLRRSIKDNGR